MVVEIYSDIACPWCYIGKRRFERALASRAPGGDVDIVHRPYQLEPDASSQPMPLADRLAAKFGPRAPALTAHVTAAAAGEGIEMRMERALAVNTLSAHRLLWLAGQAYGAPSQRSLVEGLFDAYFVSGGNVADPDQLAQLAVSAGLDRSRVAAYLASDEGLAEVRRDIAAAQRRGIIAVPTFVFDGVFAVEGAQTPATFCDVLDELARPATSHANAPAEVDACAADTCAP